jgi:hypothetical protein
MKNYWITMQKPYDKKRRLVWVTESNRDTAEQIKNGDLVVVDVYARGIQYIGEVERLLNLDPDGPPDEKGRQWLKVAKLKNNLIADGDICDLETLAQILQPDWDLDSDGRRKILAIRQRGACKVSELSDGEMKKIWPSLTEYLSQSISDTDEKAEDSCENDNEPEFPDFPPQKIKEVVEKHAVRKVKKYLKEQGFKVSPYQLRLPYDLEGILKGRRFTFEVKGTQNSLSDVVIFLTPSEVSYAHENKDTWKLFIVHSIKVQDIDGELMASGGILDFIPWSKVKKHINVCLYTFKPSKVIAF